MELWKDYDDDDSRPDIDEYFDKYGDLDQYDKDYDEWYFSHSDDD